MARKRSDGIRLTRIEIVNFKKIRAVVFEPQPGLNRITSGGKNRQGKTSTIDALRVLFEGAGAVPPEPKNDQAGGDSETYVKGWFSNGFTIRRNITEKGTYLKALSPDGLEAKQSHLDNWRGGTGVDVLGWFALPIKEQIQQLARLSSVPDLLPELAKLEKSRTVLHDERTPHIQAERAYQAVKQPKGERPTLVDTSTELRKLGELQALQRARQDQLREFERARDFARTRAQDQHRQLRADVDASEAALKDAEEELERARDDVKRLQEALAKAQENLTKGQQHVLKVEERMMLAGKSLATAGELLEAAKPVEDAVDAFPVPDFGPDPQVEINGVLERMAAADDRRKASEPWDAFDQAQKNLERAKAERVRLTKQIEAMDAVRVELIAAAKFPVQGLDLTADGELRLNNRPLEQASGREKRELAVAVALADNPKLRIVILDEGSDIDVEGVEHLAKLCEENDLQLMLCRLGVEGPGELEVLDGYGGDWKQLFEKPEEGDDGAAAAEAEAKAKQEVPVEEGGGLFG